LSESYKKTYIHDKESTYGVATHWEFNPPLPGIETKEQYEQYLDNKIIEAEILREKLEEVLGVS
jgi:hypothetical protein